ncbi:MAG: hypothetical protein FWD24_04805 [Treponema sp.]|nr:hypothetical protein [Treponema sp.]
MKIVFVFIFIFVFPFFIFASDLQEQYRSGYFIIRPSNNRLTVIGVSNIMTRREDEIISAREDAARKVAMYFGIHGIIESINSTGMNFFDYSHESDIELNYDNNFEKYIEQLTFDPQIDVLRTNEAVFVRFQHNTTVTSLNYRATSTNGRPNWTRNQNMPEIAGFITSVGFSRNQRRLKDTIFRSAEDAITRMIQDMSTTVNTREVSVAEHGSSSVIHARSEGKINNFQIIEIWIDPVSRSVYSLAIARIGE